MARNEKDKQTNNSSHDIQVTTQQTTKFNNFAFNPFCNHVPRSKKFSMLHMGIIWKEIKAFLCTCYMCQKTK